MLMPRFANLANYENNYEFTILFNFGSFARVFMGFINPLLPFDEIIQVIADNFSLSIDRYTPVELVSQSIYSTLLGNLADSAVSGYEF